ncbi:hypothetical protein FRB99_008115 [Tulasnella sp. 403]|nr:hypothetical protein FRB99_008115 [Tulasnella sp. 403]
MASGFIRHIYSQSDLNTLLNDKPVVLLDFYAAWCGPCKTIAPLFAQYAEKYKTVTFAKVDVDKVQSVSKKYNVTAMPTFVLIKNKEEAARLRGADPKALEDLITAHAPKAGQVASGSGSADAPAASDVSLLEYLDMAQVNCLNESSEHTLQSIVRARSRNTTDAYLESDADEQLLINLGFNQVVRIRSLVLHTKNPSKGPKTIKIAINKPAIGFDDVENATEPEVVQVFDVPEDMVQDGKYIHLRYVRLQYVTSFHIFVSSNHGDEDETRIDAIDVFGQPVATPQMSGLRKVEED